MAAPPPVERQLVARLAAHESWAQTPDRTARTAPARAAFLAKFDAIVDPDGVLQAEERARRAANARRAHFLRLALKSAQARRASTSRSQALSELTEATALLALVTDGSREPADAHGHSAQVPSHAHSAEEPRSASAGACAGGASR